MKIKIYIYVLLIILVILNITLYFIYQNVLKDNKNYIETFINTDNTTNTTDISNNVSMAPFRNMEQIDHDFYGNIVIFDKTDLISELILKNEIWEYDLCKHMANLYKPGTDVLDIGANLGLNSLALNKIKKINGTIHLFEPQPDVFMMMKYNTRNLPCKLYNICLSKDCSYLAFDQDKDNVGGTRILPGQSGRTNVACIPLDKIEFKTPISLIKMDVEGAEEDVLLGARMTLIKHKPAIIMEIWKDKYESVEKTLKSLNYRIDKKIGFHDYICLPQ